MWTKSLCAVGILALSASALAQVPAPPRRTGLYVVGTIGASQGNDRTLSTDRAVAAVGADPNVRGDTKRFVGSAGVGYRFNDYFGLELGFMDLGRMELQATGTGTFDSRTKIRGAHATLVGFLPTTQDVSFYAKFGGVRSRASYEASDGFSEKASTTRTYWGLGLQVFFNDQVFGRLEYLRFTSLGSSASGDSAFNHYNLGVGYLF